MDLVGRVLSRYEPGRSYQDFLGCLASFLIDEFRRVPWQRLAVEYLILQHRQAVHGLVAERVGNSLRLILRQLLVDGGGPAGTLTRTGY